jgi:hypothetical protein
VFVMNVDIRHAHHDRVIEPSCGPRTRVRDFRRRNVGIDVLSSNDNVPLAGFSAIAGNGLDGNLAI